MDCSVEITGDIQKELSYKQKAFSIFLFIIGLFGLFAYFGLKMFFYELWVELIFFGSIILLVLGILMYAGYNTARKKIKGAGVINHYEFSPTSMVVSHERNDEIESTIKILYKNIKKIKETKHYLFLYVSRKAALPIEKNSLKPEEISTIKIWVTSERMGKTRRLDVLKKNGDDANYQSSQQDSVNQAMVQEEQRRLAEKMRMEQEKENQKYLEAERKKQEKLMKIEYEKAKKLQQQKEKEEKKQMDLLLKRKKK